MINPEKRKRKRKNNFVIFFDTTIFSFSLPATTHDNSAVFIKDTIHTLPGWIYDVQRVAA
jgi:hypothetical protein